MAVGMKLYMKDGVGLTAATPGIACPSFAPTIGQLLLLLLLRRDRCICPTRLSTNLPNLNQLID